MIIQPWDGRSSHEKSDLRKGNFIQEMEYFNRGVYSSGTAGPPGVPSGTYLHFLSSNDIARMHNNCVNKIVEQAQVVENYFEAIYERQEALRMAATAARKLLDFIRNFRKPQYWKSFGKPKPKDLPEAWITYNFGVAPLVATIDSAMKLLGKPYPTVVLKGGSGLPLPSVVKDNSYYIEGHIFLSGTCFKQIRAHVAPRMNPNLALINVMGLSTPFSTAFSVVPWGWAVDYFVNASELMSNFEDRFPGIYFSSIWESVSYKVSYRRVLRHKETNKYTFNNGYMFNCYRRPSSLQYKLEFSFPLLGGRQFANLASAIALTLKGKS